MNHDAQTAQLFTSCSFFSISICLMSIQYYASRAICSNKTRVIFAAGRMDEWHFHLCQWEKKNILAYLSCILDLILLYAIETSDTV